MLMSAADYRESLRRFNPVVFVNGRRIESVADDPVLAPGINAIGTTYDFALEPEYRPLMLATQASSRREVDRMLHINDSGARAGATYQPKPVPAQTAARATGAGQFTTAAEAQARCPSDKVVWVNTKSHIYHYAGTHSYGTTKQGAYMCEADASAAGDRASKSRIDRPKQQP